MRALEARGVRMIGEGVRVRKAPSAEDLAKCRELGRAMAESVTGGEENG